MTVISRIVCWFSCGAASAVATKLAIVAADGREVVVVYQDTGAEHPDNVRFMADCSRWFGLPIQTIRSNNYSDIWDVFERTRYLVGVGGARCTSELKRRVAEDFLNHGSDLEVIGYTVEERGRLEKWIANNNERAIWPVLVERNLRKVDCFDILTKAGIELPAMYKLGYRNNNCIGCVKGQAGYWNKIRVDFPEVFARMAKVERSLNAAICKTERGGVRQRVFLDELPPDAGRYEAEPSISCGLFCGTNDGVSP